MSKDAREAMRQAAERIMGSGETFSYSGLWMSLYAPPGSGIDPGRLADQCIQRWRKKGWIHPQRLGRNTYWSLTDAGREAMALRAHLKQ